MLVFQVLKFFLGKSILFCAKEEESNVDFHGTNIGPQRAVKFFGVDEARYNTELPSFLKDHITTHQIKRILHSGINMDLSSSSALFTPLIFQAISSL